MLWIKFYRMPEIAKPLAIICFVWVFAVWIYPYPACYLTGYLVTDCLMRWNLLLWVTSLLPLLVLFFTWVISIIRRKDWRCTTGAILGLAVLAALEQVLPCPPVDEIADLEMYGLRDRMMHDATPDDLRNFAHDIDRQIPDLDLGFGHLTDLTPYQAAVLSKLRVKYPFLYWRSNLGPTIDETDGVVNMEWGNDEHGHWGVRISAHGGKIADPTQQASDFEQPTKILRVGNDIFFYIED